VNLDAKVYDNVPFHPLYSRRTKSVLYEISAFHTAVTHGHVELINFFIERNECKFDTVDRDGRTPLHTAVLLDRVDICKILLKTTQRVPNMLLAFDNFHKTPLFLAAQTGKDEIIQFFLKQTYRRKPDIEAPSISGATPFFAAVYNNHLDCAKLLFAKKCNVECKKHGGTGPLHAACYRCNLPMIDFLIEVCKVDADTEDDYLRTPFFIACEQGDLEIVKYLAGKEVNMTASYANAYAPQEIANKNGCKEVAFFVGDLVRKQEIERQAIISAQYKQQVDEKAAAEKLKNSVPKFARGKLTKEELEEVAVFSKGRNLINLDRAMAPEEVKVGFMGFGG
jgi:ankyrin repeat protein